MEQTSLPHASMHSVRQARLQSKLALEEARAAVAHLVGATSPSEIVFTACGTESNNWALAGAALAWRAEHPGSTPHVVASAVEHPAVTECLAALASLVCTAQHCWSVCTKL